MLMPIRKWRNIDGYEGYLISNTGEVKSIKSNKLLSTFDSHGYRRVEIRKDGKPKKFMVHRLVAENFIDNPNNYPQVNHKDENKLNNFACNLEWCTEQYNSCYGTRLHRLSVRNGKSVNQIKDGNVINTFHSVNEAERQTGISHSIINRVCNGKGFTAGGYEWKYA